MLRLYYAYAYWSDGFSFEQGWRLSPQRELYGTSGHDTVVFWILMVALPLFARERSAKRCAIYACAWVLLAMLGVSMMHWIR